MDATGKAFKDDKELRKEHIEKKKKNNVDQRRQEKRQGGQRVEKDESKQQKTKLVDYKNETNYEKKDNRPQKKDKY